MTDGSITYREYFDQQFAQMRQDIRELKAAITAYEKSNRDLERRVRDNENAISIVRFIVGAVLIPLSVMVIGGIVLAITVWWLGIG